jgi:hypothetical protein
MTTYRYDFDQWQPRPTLEIPAALLPAPDAQGCVVAVHLRDGRVVKGLAVDSKGLVYGVRVRADVDERPNPIDFTAEDIVKVKRMNMRWQRFLLSRWCPRGYKVV